MFYFFSKLGDVLPIHVLLLFLSREAPKIYQMSKYKMQTCDYYSEKSFFFKETTYLSLIFIFQLSIFPIFFVARMTLWRMSSGIMMPRLMMLPSTSQSHRVSTILIPCDSVTKIFSVWRNHCPQCFGSLVGLVSGIFPVWT